MVSEKDIFIALNELYHRIGTQKGLAERAGITQSTICAYLKGNAKIANMPLGVFVRLFRDMQINYFGEKTGDVDADRRRASLLAIFDTLTPEQQMDAIVLIASRFPHNLSEKS